MECSQQLYQADFGLQGCLLDQGVGKGHDIEQAPCTCAFDCWAIYLLYKKKKNASWIARPQTTLGLRFSERLEIGNQCDHVDPSRGEVLRWPPKARRIHTFGCVLLSVHCDLAFLTCGADLLSVELFST